MKIKRTVKKKEVSPF